MIIRKILLCLLSIFLSPHLSLASDLNNTFEQLKANPIALYNFVKTMPKGGDLHYHLDGGVSSELMLSLGSHDHYCLDRTAFSVTKNPEICTGVNLAELKPKSELYEKTLAAWSIKHFDSSKESGHDHVFSAFAKFYAIVADNPVPILASVMQKASKQNISYLEIIHEPSYMIFVNPNFLKQSSTNFDEFRQNLLNQPEFLKEISRAAADLDSLEVSAKQDLGCKAETKDPVCKLAVRFQYFVLREQPIDKVFIQALQAFEVASRSKAVVGVNLVQPEDGKISLADYRKQMQVFAFMNKLYPKVHISLHAGELSPSLVSPKDLSFHIHDAIFVGKAQRIGHAVDLKHEISYKKLLDYMAANKIAVEINLSSNKVILEIAGKEHPLQAYLEHMVPVVLATDDEGILRTNLSRQYFIAAKEHNLSYQDLKQISRASLSYSFLPGKSIWEDAKQTEPVPACRDLGSKGCLAFIKLSQKAELQRKLELEFLEFEKIPRTGRGM